jgi:hypothetical protein
LYEFVGAFRAAAFRLLYVPNITLLAVRSFQCEVQEKGMPMQLLVSLVHDDAGFVVSSELILITTITVLALVVGLSAVSSGINQELDDMASCFGSINKNDRYSFESHDGGLTFKGGHGEH